MVQAGNRVGVSRRRLLQAGATVGAVQVASPYFVRALGEQPIKVG